MKLEWDYGYKVPDERRKGYTHLIRARSDPDERVKSFAEVVDTLKPGQALAESYRCLRCYRVFVAAL